MNKLCLARSPHFLTKVGAINEYRQMLFHVQQGQLSNWKELPEGDYLLVENERLLQLVSVSALEHGELDLYQRNMRQSKPKATYHMRLDASGRLTHKMDMTSHDGNIAFDDFLRGVLLYLQAPEG